jgi:hypothetical protein
MAVERSFIVKLLADPRQLIQGFQAVRGQAEKTFGETDAKVQSLLPGFRNLTIAAAGVFAGFTAGAIGAVRAAAQQEAQQQRLRQILLTTGKATQEQIAALYEQANALERVGVVAGGNINILQSQLATFDLQASTIQKLTPAIVDYVVAEKGAGASADEFRMMTNGLAQALNGQFGALTRVGFVLDENTKKMISSGTEAERADAIVKVLNSTYGGFNESLRNTTEGQLQAFRNSMDKIRTDLATAFLPIFNRVMDVFGGLANFAAQNTTAVKVFAIAVGGLSTAILALAGYLKFVAFQQRIMADETLKAVFSLKNAEGELTNTSKAAIGLGKAFSAIGISAGIFGVLNEITDTAGQAADGLKRVTIEIGQFKRIGSDGARSVVEEFNRFGRIIQNQNRFGDIISDWGREFQFTGTSVTTSIEAMDEAFRRFLDSDPEQAQEIVDALKAQLAVTDPTTRSYQDLTDAIARYERMLRLTKAAQDALTESSKGLQSWINKNIGATNMIATQHILESRARLASADSISQWNKEATQLFNKASSGKSATEKLADAKKKLQSATDSLKSAQISERNSVERLIDVQKALTNADERVTKAKDALAKAIRGYGRDSREGIAAARSLAEAQRGLERANFGVVDAQNRVIAAQKKLDDLRNRASDPNDIANAEFNLEKSKLDVEEATLAVQEAEQDLAKTMADPEASPLAKRKAELSLVSAKFGLRDAINDQASSEQNLIAVRATGATAEELAAAERELEEAKLSVQDAIDAQTRALEDLNTEQETYRKITEGIREDDAEYVELSKDIVQAEEDQATAARNLRDAREGAAGATDALRRAEEELRLSRKELRVAGGGRQSTPGRALGGSVLGDRPYLVGENGPELFVPASGGRIIPNNKMGGGTVVNVVVNAGMGASGAQIGQEIVDVLSKYTKVSGPLSQYVTV